MLFIPTTEAGACRRRPCRSAENDGVRPQSSVGQRDGASIASRRSLTPVNLPALPRGSRPPRPAKRVPLASRRAAARGSPRRGQGTAPDSRGRPLPRPRLVESCPALRAGLRVLSGRVSNRDDHGRFNGGHPIARQGECLRSLLEAGGDGRYPLVACLGVVSRGVRGTVESVRPRNFLSRGFSDQEAAPDNRDLEKIGFNRLRPR